MKTKAKAEVGGNPFGSLNQFNQLAGDQTVCVFDNNRKSAKNQRFCHCGNEILRSEVVLLKAKSCVDCRRRESEITNRLQEIVSTTRTIIRCEPCKSCKKPYALAKLSKLLVCKNCLAKAQTESPSKRNRIIAGIVANFEASLRRQIALGGVNDI